MNPITYINETISELKQVSWPSRDETIKLTSIVIAISILVGAYVGSLDLAFTSLLSQIFK